MKLSNSKYTILLNISENLRSLTNEFNSLICSIEPNLLSQSIECNIKKHSLDYKKILKGEVLKAANTETNKSCTQRSLPKEMMLSGNKLRLRADGVWELRLTIDGDRKSIYGKTQQIVKQKFDKLNSVLKSQKKKIMSLTVEEWVDQYLVVYKKAKISDKAYKGLKSMLHRYIVAKIGSRPINKITSFELQKIFNSYEYLGNTKLKLRFYVKDIFNKAYKNKLIKENVAEDIIVGKAISQGSSALTKEEQLILINTHSTYPECRLFYLYCLYSGCRRSEALNLKLSDIKDGSIHIRGTKTQKSDRFIPLFQSISELFENISTENAFTLSVSTLLREFQKILPNHTIRDLRKTFATNCYEKGVSPKVIQKWLGHTTIAMTMNTYTEVRTKFEEEEINKIDC